MQGPSSALLEALAKETSTHLSDCPSDLQVHAAISHVAAASCGLAALREIGRAGIEGIPPVVAEAMDTDSAAYDGDSTEIFTRLHRWIEANPNELRKVKAPSKVIATIATVLQYTKTCTTLADLIERKVMTFAPTSSVALPGKETCEELSSYIKLPKGASELLLRRAGKECALLMAKREACTLLRTDRDATASKRIGSLQLRLRSECKGGTRDILSARVRILDSSAPDARSKAENALALAVRLLTPVQCIVDLPNSLRLRLGYVIGRGGRFIVNLKRLLEVSLKRAVAEAATDSINWATNLHLQVTPHGLGAVALAYPLRAISYVQLSNELVQAAHDAMRAVLLENLTNAISQAQGRAHTHELFMLSTGFEQDVGFPIACSYEGERDLVKARRASKRAYESKARQQAKARKCAEARRLERWQSVQLRRSLTGSCTRTNSTQRDRVVPSMRVACRREAMWMVGPAREELEEW